MKFLSSFLMSRDVLGHPLSVNYKGSDTFQTKLGAFISIGVQMAVLAQLVLKSLDMFNMSDPSILAYQRPIYQAELDDLGDVNLKEYGMHIGIFLKPNDGEASFEIPESVGKFVSYQKT